MIFGFFSKTDPKKEIIFKQDLPTEKHGWDFFSKMKNLSLQEFKKIFEVKQLK